VVRTLPGIRDARVLPHMDEETGRSLLSCHVLVDERSLDEITHTERARRWREQLAKYLPRPMIPERWHITDRLPLAANGKWDRDAVTADSSGGGHAATAVRQAWAEVLGFDGFSEDAGFFDLGGHSVNAITLLNRIREQFAVDYPMVEFFADPTVRGMVSRLSVRGRAWGGR
jgi:acyl carrier protein